MKNRTLPLLLLLFVLVLGGAWAAYTQLSGRYASGQLVARPGASASSAQSASSREDPAPPDGSHSAASQEQEPSSGGAGAASSGSSSSPEEPVEAPDFIVVDGEGNEVRLSDFRGKPVVVNFWASWCGPCKSEMPDFNDAHARLGDQVVFLMVNMTDGERETVESAAAYVEEQGFTFPVCFDTQYSAAVAYGVYALPTTYFIDAQGCAVAMASGAIDAELLQQGIDMIHPPT